MRRADRLFDIIQALRLARTPVTAAAIAAELEVAPRTVYRDIATLQARRVPIEGAAGVGYVLRRGFELPPLMLTEEEVEAVSVGMRLLRRTGDPGLEAAARSVLTKLAAAMPEALRDQLASAPFHVSEAGAPTPGAVDLSEVRAAIRTAHKMRIEYVDLKGATSTRTICPVAVEYHVQATLICGWCELRSDYRHFRADRIAGADVLAEGFAAVAGQLMAGWLTLTRVG
ncbi:MAG: YafY family transcriptional regulator [Acetobacteraceae bacterium]|nr:YafY family transcriptional regulator [Acetobacteraceae bacterium]